MKLLGKDRIKGVKGVGNARHIVGCTLADEMAERKMEGQGITNALMDRGFEPEEIQKIRKEVGF